MTEPKHFTGRTRQRKTRWTVHLGDVVARNVITIGGLGTILAVLMVAVFLIAVALPLFLPGSVGEVRREAAPDLKQKPLNLVVDDYQHLAWTLFPDGQLETLRLDNGQVMQRRSLAEGPALTAWHFGEGSQVSLGFADGSTRSGSIGFEVALVDAAEVPEALRNIASGRVEEHDGGLLERLPGGQFRLHKLAVKLEEPVEGASSAPVALVQGVAQSDGVLLAVLDAQGGLTLQKMKAKKNFLTRKVTYTREVSAVPFKVDAHGLPAHMLLSGMGDSLMIVWADGRLQRYDTRDFDAPRLAEEVALLSDPSQSVTVMHFMLGNTTVLVGDSAGKVSAWFRIKPPRATTIDGSLLVKARELPGATSGAVASIAVSSRSRIFAFSSTDGRARLYQLTSGKLLADLSLPQGHLRAIALAPKDDAILGVSEGTLWRWALDPGHPETTLSSLFLPVWYEGYNGPEHVWQSTGGTDDFEPKLGLWSLVFGSLKATVYSLLLGVPIALLAAVFSSEFLQPRVKLRVKPVIELMASLPSVVLGFLAAIVIAPAIKDVVPAVLLLFVCVPISMLLGGYLYQLLPEGMTLRLAPYRLLLVGLICLPAGIAFSFLLGPTLERLAFAGDMMAWLDGQRGSGVGGWMILLFPVSAIASAMIVNRFVSPAVRSATMSWDRGRCAVADLGKFVLGLSVALGLALAGSWLLNSAGWDPRGTYIGTYVQRNALVVGFVMGFAIIPLIYTIADDALSSVPEQLRSASLGAGATPWQTASRIIIPTAMSGLFSAVMIGVGRAVGETMIVLMAAGNTPVRDLNMFNGFRTLSANIAVELPEAVRGSTHYRTLFLAALVLFIITFILNTVAEVVRQRFRKRAFQL